MPLLIRSSHSLMIHYSATWLSRAIREFAVRTYHPVSVSQFVSRSREKVLYILLLSRLSRTGCDPCPSGYHGHHSQGIVLQSGIDHTFQRQRCEDVDECREGIARCGSNSQCVNTEGSYECTCSRGFARNATYGCMQVPGMCPDGTICDRHAVCQHAGSHRYR
jgi:hypothetical protein